MKKNIFSKTIKFAAVLAVFFASFSFYSCYNDLYGMINQEVPLETNGISGNISSFTRAGNYIWVSNGNIYYKTNAPASEYYAQTGSYNGQWNKVSIPVLSSTENYIVKSTAHFISADENNLYTMIYVWYENSDGENDIESRHLYTAKIDSTTAASSITSSDWSEIDISSISGSNTKAAISLFDNQAVADENRIAYARIYDSSSSSYKVYQLNGSTSLSSADEISENGAGSSTCSAIYFPKDGKTYFSSYYALNANSTYIYFSKTTTSSSNVSLATSLYYANGHDGSNFTLDGESAQEVALGSAGILSIGVTSNYLLLGTSAGLRHTALTSDIPSSSLSDFSSGNNAKSVISEYVFKVFILDPTKQDDATNSTNGTDEYCASAIYGSISSSSDSFDETGLYSYYPDRGTWNRDGTSDDESKGN